MQWFFIIVLQYYKIQFVRCYRNKKTKQDLKSDTEQALVLPIEKKVSYELFVFDLLRAPLKAKTPN